MKNSHPSKYKVTAFSLMVLTFASFIASTGWATVIEGNLEVKARTGANGDLKVAGTTTSASLTVGGVSNASVPRGVIVMWSGDPTDLPAGWALCNGENSIPDLRGRFIVGYSGTTGDYDQTGKNGGSDSIELTENNMPAHTHTVDGGAHAHDFAGQNDGGGDNQPRFGMSWLAKNNPGRAAQQGSGGTHSHTVSTEGESEAFDNRPAYYVLAYIIKL